jgi:hypothetical protein
VYSKPEWQGNVKRDLSRHSGCKSPLNTFFGKKLTDDFTVGSVYEDVKRRAPPFSKAFGTAG